MKWPFRRKHEETDLRIFRDHKSGELMLHMEGNIGWPSKWEREAIVQVRVILNTQLSESVARQLRDQLNGPLSKDDEVT